MNIMPFWRKKSSSKLTEKELLVMQKAEAEAITETQAKRIEELEAKMAGSNGVGGDGGGGPAEAPDLGLAMLNPRAANPEVAFDPERDGGGEGTRKPDPLLELDLLLEGGNPAEMSSYYNEFFAKDLKDNPFDDSDEDDNDDLNDLDSVEMGASPIPLEADADLDNSISNSISNSNSNSNSNGNGSGNSNGNNNSNSNNGTIGSRQSNKSKKSNKNNDNGNGSRSGSSQHQPDKKKVSAGTAAEFAAGLALLLPVEAKVGTDARTARRLNTLPDSLTALGKTDDELLAYATKFLEDHDADELDDVLNDPAFVSATDYGGGGGGSGGGGGGGSGGVRAVTLPIPSDLLAEALEHAERVMTRLPDDISALQPDKTLAKFADSILDLEAGGDGVAINAPNADVVEHSLDVDTLTDQDLDKLVDAFLNLTEEQDLMPREPS